MDNLNSGKSRYIGDDINFGDIEIDVKIDLLKFIKKEDFSKKFDFMDCVNCDNGIINLFMEFYFEKYNENIMGQIAISKFRKIYETEFVDWLYKGF